MVNKALCRVCIYRAYVSGMRCCGYLLYTGKRRVPLMDPNRPNACPVMVKGDPIAFETRSFYLWQKNRPNASEKSAIPKE